MKIFDSFNNIGNERCRICNQGTEKKTIIVPIVGTEKGNKIKAMQLHLDCIDLLCQEKTDGSALLFQFIPPKGYNDDNEIDKTVD